MYSKDNRPNNFAIKLKSRKQLFSFTIHQDKVYNVSIQSPILGDIFGKGHSGHLTSV